MYAAAEHGRLMSDWFAQSTSHDAELRASLRTLRNRSRQLVRDNDYAKNAMRVIKNNVIGQGVRFQAQVKKKRGGLDKANNELIESYWDEWCEKLNCDVSGKNSLAEMQRILMGAVAESGEVLVRKVRGQKFGDSPVAFALEIIEADQLVEEWSGRTEGGNEVRMGVEVNQWQRPVAYWLYPRHPGDYQFIPGQVQTNRLIRVPADEIYHLFVSERPGATRGVPWLHTAARRLNNMGGYEEAEIIAARADASPVGTIESPEAGDPTEDATGVSGAEGVRQSMRQFDMSAGTLMELADGEKYMPWHPTRPNTAMDGFMRLMLRGVAAGIGVSYESLSRDYSQSNYSSSRLALLDDRDLWRCLQDWFVEHFLQDVYREWLEMAVLGGVLKFPDYETNLKRYRAVRWMPRGWEWIDPLKEVTAARLGIRSGLQTQQGVLSAKGDDVEDLMNQRRRELDLAAELKMVFDTDVQQVTDKGQAQPLPVVQETDTGTPVDTGNADAERTPDVAQAEDALAKAILNLERASARALRHPRKPNGHATRQ
jgi:lambda family phage portal protein